MNDTERINKVISGTLRVLEASKEIFEEYLRDESIQLDERWSVWVNTPSLFKNHEPYCISIDGVDDDTIIGYCQDRYATYDVAELIESLEESEIDEEFDINKVKAYMLKRNIGSFQYDW